MRAAAPQWTQDDILVAAAETFSLLPRPSGAATDAFTALLVEYWPSAEAETRGRVNALLRGSAHCSARVIEVLDMVSAPVAERVRRAPRIRSAAAAPKRASAGRVAVTPPPLAPGADTLAQCMWSDMADQDRMVDEAGDGDVATDPVVPSDIEEGNAAHARALLRRVALTGERGPVVQPRSIAERLDASDGHVAVLADLLHLPESDAGVVLSNVPGTLIALRTLGVSAGRAVRLVAKWHGVESAPLLPAYRGLRLTQCLDAVADWRNIAARGEEVANDGAEVANDGAGTQRTALSA